MSMAETLSVRLEKSVLHDLFAFAKELKTDRSEAVRMLLAKALQEWKTEMAMQQLQMHKISIGMAARRCGLNLWEMLDLAKQRKIDWTGYSKEDLEKDLTALEGR